MLRDTNTHELMTNFAYACNKSVEMNPSIEYIYIKILVPVLLRTPFVIKVIRFRQLPHYLIWQKQNVSHYCQPVKRAFSISPCKWREQ